MSLVAIYKAQVAMTPAAVTTAADRADERFKRRAGGLGRKIARERVRRRKRASQPDETPSQRHPNSKALGPKAVYYATDGNGVVIGLLDLASDPDNVPEAWEHGGTLTIETPPERDGRRRSAKTKHRVRVKARPIVGPVPEIAAPKLAALLKDDVR